MSVAAVLNALFLNPNLLSVKSRAHIFKQQFQQLGHDRSTGHRPQIRQPPGCTEGFSATTSSNLPPHLATIIIPLARPVSPSRRIPSNSFFPDWAKICNREILSKAQSAYAPLQQEFAQLRSALRSTLSSAASGNALTVKLRFRQGKPDLPCLLFPCSCFPLVPHFVFPRQRAIFLFSGECSASPCNADPARFVSLREQRDEGSRPPPLQN
jgi:hypothetical protein